LAGFAYLTVMLRPWQRRFWKEFVWAEADMDSGVRTAIEIGIAAALTGGALLAWIWPGRKAALDLTESEIATLFAAPLTRRQVIDYSLFKAQLGIGLSAAIVGFFALRLLSSSAPRAIAGAWVAFSAFHLYLLGVSIARTSLIRHGWGGLRAAWPGLAAAVAAAGAAGWGIASGGLRAPTDADLEAPAAYVVAMGEAPGLGWVLAPARLLVGPVVAQDAGSFLARLLGALALLAAAYVWVVRSDFAYEEASAELAARREARRAARARGQRRYERVAASSRRTPFRLASSGPPARAILWKSLVATWRTSAMPYVIAASLAAALVAPAAAAALKGRAGAVGMVVAAQLAALAAVTSLAGAEMIRTDLRSDLLHAAAVRSWPVTGPSLMAAEVAGPAIVLSVLQGLLLAAAVPFLPGRWGMSRSEWILLAAAAWLLLAPLNVLSSVVSNAAVILFPAWHHLGPGRARGFEAFGQNLVTGLARALVLLVAVLPAALVVAGILFLGWPRLGAASAPPAAAAGAIVLGVEGWLGIGAAGLLFERFDPSRELDVAA
jgi:hypothetical protein